MSVRGVAVSGWAAVAWAFGAHLMLCLAARRLAGAERATRAAAWCETKALAADRKQGEG